MTSTPHWIFKKWTRPLRVICWHNIHALLHGTLVMNSTDSPSIEPLLYLTRHGSYDVTTSLNIQEMNTSPSCDMLTQYSCVTPRHTSNDFQRNPSIDPLFYLIRDRSADVTTSLNIKEMNTSPSCDVLTQHSRVTPRHTNNDFHRNPPIEPLLYLTRHGSYDVTTSWNMQEMNT